MTENIFETQLKSIQMKKAKKEQMRAFKRIDTEINRLAEEWLARYLYEMEETINLEPDPEVREIMQDQMYQFLAGFEQGYACGFLRMRADE